MPNIAEQTWKELEASGHGRIWVRDLDDRRIVVVADNGCISVVADMNDGSTKIIGGAIDAEQMPALYAALDETARPVLREAWEHVSPRARPKC